MIIMAKLKMLMEPLNFLALVLEFVNAVNLYNIFYPILLKISFMYFSSRFLYV